MTYSAHGVKVVCQIMNRVYTASQRLCRYKEVPKVGAGVASTDPAAALGSAGPWSWAKRAFLILIRPSEVKSSPAGLPASADTVHHVHSHRGVSYDFLWIPHTHCIPRACPLAVSPIRPQSFPWFFRATHPHLVRQWHIRGNPAPPYAPPTPAADRHTCRLDNSE